MKTLFHLLTVSFLLITASCKQPKSTEPDPINPTGDVTIKVKNEAGGIALQESQMLYTNSSGNLYSVDLLKYYISNVILIKDDGSEFKLNNYDLINAFDVNFSTLSAIGVPNGNYTSMKFSVGIDATRNHTGAQTGDLDPVHNMLWTWSTGYIFFKHEGNFKNIGGTDQPLIFHLGTDNAYASHQIPISLTVAGVNKTMNIVFDLNKMYNSPAIDFNINNNHQSSSAADAIWISNMVANEGDAFSFKNVE